MMKYLKSKVVIGIVAIIVFVALVFIALNTSYFYKQAKFVFNKPNPENAQQINADHKMEPNRIIISSLGVDAPIVESLESNEKAYQEALKNGVVHFPGTAEVGAVGNAYLFGHSSDFAFKGGDYKTVFALLPSIKNDAEIFVSNKEGVVFKYKVVKQFVAQSTDLHLLDQDTGGKKVLTIQTSYPIGTALKRYIVVAELVE